MKKLIIEQIKKELEEIEVNLKIKDFQEVLLKMTEKVAKELNDKNKLEKEKMDIKNYITDSIKMEKEHLIEKRTLLKNHLNILEKTESN